MNTKPLKVFQTDDSTWYAAEDAEHAARLYVEDTGEACEDGYPRELTDAEMEKQYREFDEYEQPTSRTTTPREMLVGALPGFLAGTEW